MPFNLTREIDKTNLIMDLIGVKQEAVGSNIANVNTPGYVRKDVCFEQYIGALRKPLETNLSKKVGPCPLLEEVGDEVIIAEELMAMQRNSLLYSMASRRTSMLIQELKTVSQSGR